MRAMQTNETSFLSGANVAFVTELYARYAEDPQSVEPGWRSYFASLGEEAAAALGDLRGPSWAPRQVGFGNGSAANGAGGNAHAALRDAPDNGAGVPAAVI